MPFLFEFVRMWSNYTIERFRVVFAMPSIANVVFRHSADGGALYCLIGGRHRNGGQSADNPDFTVCIIRCVYRAELILVR